MTIEELISRLEKAEGPNYALEMDIHTATMPALAGGYVHPLKYTASIDAAAALCARLLPGISWSTGQIEPDLASAFVHAPTNDTPAVMGISKTPALALCLAIRKLAESDQCAS